ncbi:MAG: PAS domain S-box protein [Deltaproteobacteria bacterium]|nr:PAS domain S-box protein [Deltaproteobacteria bacterium]
MDVRALDAVGEAIVVTDVAGRIVHWTPAAERLFGWPAAEVLGRDVLDVIPAEMTRTQAHERLARLTAGEAWTGQFLVRRRDGTAFLAWVTATPQRDDAGTVTAVIGVFRDLAPVLAANATLAPLAELGRILGASLDYEKAAADLARALVPAFADLCAVIVLDEPTGPRWLALAAGDGTHAAELNAIRAAPLHPRARANIEEVMRTGRVKFVADHLAAIPDASEAYDASVIRLGPGATLVAPLIAHGHAIGALSFAMTRRSQRRFGPADGAFAEEIGQRVGLAIDNARVHTELRRSEERLRLALAVAPISLFAHDRDLRYTWLRSPLSQDPARVLGLTDDEVQPGQAAEIMAHKRAVLTTGRSARAVIAAKVGTGVRHYDLALEPMRDAADAIVGVTGAAWDVTEQRQLMAQLRLAEATVRRLIDDAPEPYFLAEPDGRFVDVNAAAVALTGYARDELLAMNVAELVVPEETERAAKLRELPPGTTSIRDWRVRRKSGELVELEVHGRVMPDRQRQAFARDITDRKRAERAGAQLLAVEQRHRARLEQLSQAALLIAPLDQRFPAAVRSVLRRILDQATDLVDAGVAAIGLGEDLAEPYAPWLSTGGVGAAGDDDPIVPCPPADPHAAVAAVFPGVALDAFLAVPLRRDGRAIGHLYLGRPAGRGPFSADDAATLGLLVAHGAIAVENARLYAEREAAVRAREELLAIVSHDLRNPLRAIELREDLLARTHDAPALREHARGVRSAVASMRRLIQNLLDATSLGLERLRLELGDHDLAGIADEALELLGAVALSHDVRLEVQLRGLPLVRVDRERIAQTFYNLIGNALRFTPAGGEVVIAASARAHAIEVVVADSGPGIAPEDLPRVFDRYFTTATGHEGTGLGLYIVKGVVDAHGGRIWIDPAPGRGCAVHFELPMAGAAEAAR